MRESRYFTALKAYKHGARGRKSRCLWSKPERGAVPTLPCREPGGAQSPGRWRLPRARPGRDGAPRLLHSPRRPPCPTRRAPGPSRCRERLRSDWGRAIPSAPWGRWTKVTDSRPFLPFPTPRDPCPLRRLLSWVTLPAPAPGVRVGGWALRTPWIPLPQGRTGRAVEGSAASCCQPGEGADGKPRRDECARGAGDVSKAGFPGEPWGGLSSTGPREDPCY